MPRPYTLFIYSLKVIPNTELEKAMKERGIDLEAISANYGLTHLPPRVANLVLYMLAVCRPPRWLFDRLLRRVQGSATPQQEYPRTGHGAAHDLPGQAVHRPPPLHGLLDHPRLVRATWSGGSG